MYLCARLGLSSTAFVIVLFTSELINGLPYHLFMRCLIASV
jgi:hypothetical protein